MKNILFVVISTLLISCGVLEADEDQNKFLNTLSFNGESPEHDGLIKEISPTNNRFTLSWSARKGFSSKVYLSTSEYFRGYAWAADFQEGVDYITSFEAGKGVDVNIECQVDESFTVFECVSAGQDFGTREQLINQLLPDGDDPKLYLMVHHFEEFKGGRSDYMATYHLVFKNN